jgi:hypothetical protein
MEKTASTTTNAGKSGYVTCRSLKPASYTKKKNISKWIKEHNART